MFAETPEPPGAVVEKPRPHPSAPKRKREWLNVQMSPGFGAGRLWKTLHGMKSSTSQRSLKTFAAQLRPPHVQSSCMFAPSMRQAVSTLPRELTMNL